MITGQEQTDIPFATHAAATVEMAANLLDKEYDCVVIDEVSYRELSGFLSKFG